MEKKICLLFCDYFQEEVEFLLQQSNDANLTARFYSADCDKTQQAATVLKLFAAQATAETVIVFCGVCLSFTLQKLAIPHLQIEHSDVCFELLLPAAVLQKTLASGAHLLTNGMVKRWPQVQKNWGFDQQSRADFFAEGATKLVLISHEHLPANEAAMAEVARQLHLPWEKLQISLAHLQQRIFQAINR